MRPVSGFINMSYRFMRVLVFFDLPTESHEERRAYRKFRRYLIKNGFMMLQESVYAKLALNTTQVNQILTDVKKEQPTKGLVQILTVTEKQFSKMEILCGKSNTDVINSDERLLIL
jgi:CRISPR-associated protein Cas2